MKRASDSHPPIAFVVAIGRNNEIGHRGVMPWHLPADLKHFKSVTMGHTLLMGRRTFESIGRPLPGRDNFIVSRNAGFAPSGCRVFTSTDAALAAAPADDWLMVIGGATLYQALLPQAQRIYLTRISAVFEADTFFPPLPANEWRETSREDHEADERNAYAYSFMTLERHRAVGG